MKLGIPFSSYRRRALKLGCYKTNQGGKGTKKKKNKVSYKYSININAFDNWNEEMAYWLGFLCADGNVHSTRDRFSLVLKIDDKSHLEKFNIFLSSDYKIIDYKTNKNLINNNACNLTVSSKHIRNRLIELGVIPNKSYTDIDFLKFVPDNFKMPFIIGYFDGDGSISSSLQAISFVSNKEFLHHVKEYLTHNISIEWTNLYYKTENCSVLSSSRKNEIIKFAKVYCSYVNVLPLLDRKLILMKELLYNYDKKIIKEDKVSNEILVCKSCNISISKNNSNGLCKYCNEGIDFNKIYKLVILNGFSKVSEEINMTPNGLKKRLKSLGFDLDEKFKYLCEYHKYKKTNSGLKYVFLERNNMEDKFIVSIWFNNKSNYFGRYDNRKIAAKVADKKMVELFGTEVLTNKKLGLIIY